jgi:hypothetical protein
MVWLGQVGQVTELPSFTWLFYTWSRWAIAVREVKIITQILRRKKGLLSCCGSSNVGVLTKVMILQNAIIDFSLLLLGRCQITWHCKLAAHERQTWEWAFGLAFSVTGKLKLTKPSSATSSLIFMMSIHIIYFSCFPRFLPPSALWS